MYEYLVVYYDTIITPPIHARCFILRSALIESSKDILEIEEDMTQLITGTYKPCIVSFQLLGYQSKDV
jgi:hypothetical protein